ncbi:MAG TPA: DUF364 domain-containing protein [Syntrophales bacterium]|nr:DUF364 domain-containing protein [Syntrophales bacterium]HPQ43530.1 DUF364 domain-containing protein [Syntrophales bacterium]
MELLNSILEGIKEDAPVEAVRMGLHWTAVVSRRCGLASTMGSGGCNHGESEGMEGSFTDMTALGLVRYCFDDFAANASLGLATVNSLLTIDPDKYSNVEGLQIVKDMGKGKNISVIGHFPHLDALAREAKNLWIIEKRPRPGDYPEEEGSDLIPRSDIVVISSTTLMNGTLSGILGLCKKGSVKMLLGPTTPLSDVFFDYGIDMLAGSVVTETDVVLKSVGEGASFMQIKKKGGMRFVTIIRDYDDIVRRLTA